MKIPITYLIAIAIIIAVAIYYEGRRSAQKEQIITNWQSKARLYQIKANQWQDSATRKQLAINKLEQEVVILAHESDSLSKREMTIVNHIIHLPAVTASDKQIDSLWRRRYHY